MTTIIELKTAESQKPARFQVAYSVEYSGHIRLGRTPLQAISEAYSKNPERFKEAGVDKVYINERGCFFARLGEADIAFYVKGVPISISAWDEDKRGKAKKALEDLLNSLGNESIRLVEADDGKFKN